SGIDYIICSHVRKRMGIQHVGSPLHCGVSILATTACGSNAPHQTEATRTFMYAVPALATANSMRQHRQSCANSVPDALRKYESVFYSITSSASASSLSGILRPSALAVLRLMTSSYLVGACTGRSPGFSPLRIRSM